MSPKWRAKRMGEGFLHLASNDLEDTLRSLVIQSQGGDAEAYEKFLREAEQYLRRWMQKQLSGFGTVDDVIQEILISLHLGLKSYLPERRFLPWFNAIAKRRMIDHIRKVARQRSREVYGPEILDSLAAPQPLLKNQESGVMVALKNLPSKYKEPVLMMKIEGRSAQETAEALGLSLSAVKTRCSRAFKMMAQTLERQLHES
jgi:RNA polymerase sigma-70 factor, ECF subfamily